jgi:tetratricopeptide (TPR) repeat protein
LKTPNPAAGAAPRGVVIDAQVRTTDILPTILAATGIPAPPELNGESLFPLLENHSNSNDKKSDEKSGRQLFGETDYPLRWGWAPLRALRTENAKLIEAPRPELYDLQADPKETKNLYAADAANLQALQAEMAKWEAKLPTPNNFAKSEKLPDPKDKIEVQNLLHNAMLASDDNRSNDARQFLEKAAQLDPTSPNAVMQLGEIELAAGDYAKAAAHLKRASQLRPDDPTAAYEAGEAMEKSGDFAGARDSLEASLKLAPGQMPARLLLGHVYLQLKDAKNAADQFEAALLVDSDNTEGRLGLADAQVQQSEFAAALPDLEALTKSDPRNAAALHLLAQAYRGLGREPDAKRIEAQAAALDRK